MSDQPSTPHVQSNNPGALNVAGAMLGHAARAGLLPRWALVAITALSSVLGTGILAQFLPPVAESPVEAAPAAPVMNVSGGLELTMEQFLAYQRLWQREGRRQALHDIAQDIHVGPSPENLLNLIAGLVLGSEPPIPRAPEEVEP